MPVARTQRDAMEQDRRGGRKARGGRFRDNVGKQKHARAFEPAPRSQHLRLRVPIPRSKLKRTDQQAGRQFLFVPKPERRGPAGDGVRRRFQRTGFGALRHLGLGPRYVERDVSKAIPRPGSDFEAHVQAVRRRRKNHGADRIPGSGSVALVSQKGQDAPCFAMQRRFGIPLPARLQTQGAVRIDGRDAQDGGPRQPRMLIGRQVVDPGVLHVPYVRGRAGRDAENDRDFLRRERIDPGNHLGFEEPFLPVQKTQAVQVRLEHVHVEHGKRLAARDQRIAQPFSKGAGLSEAVQPQPNGHPRNFGQPAVRLRADPAGQDGLAERIVALEGNAAHDERIHIRLFGGYSRRSGCSRILGNRRGDQREREGQPGDPGKKNAIRASATQRVTLPRNKNRRPPSDNPAKLLQCFRTARHRPPSLRDFL